jgi:hypothetical protein
LSIEHLNSFRTSLHCRACHILPTTITPNQPTPHQKMWHPHVTPPTSRRSSTKSTTTRSSSSLSDHDHDHDEHPAKHTHKHPHAHAVSDALVYLLGYLFAPASYQLCTCSAANAAACTAGRACRPAVNTTARAAGAVAAGTPPVPTPSVPATAAPLVCKGCMDEDVRVLTDPACGAREKREARKRWERRRWSEVPYFGGL